MPINMQIEYPKLEAENIRLRQECAAKDKRIWELEEGLRQIAYPLKYLQEEARREGNNIDGVMAIQLCNDANWLKEKAKQLLTP